MLQEREKKFPAESLQEGAVHAVKESFRRHIQVLQDPQPQSFMGKEQGFPTVESGNRDARTFTDFLHTCPVQEVIPQYKEDEAQGIRGIRHQGAGEQSMGMAAGTALVTLHGHVVRDRKSLFPLHQVTCIGRKRGHSSLCMADRADTVCMAETPCFLFKPLPVRKRDLVQLAKNGK